MQKRVLALLALACCLFLPACGKKGAPIVLPDPEKILSINVTTGEASFTWEDPQQIRRVIEELSSSVPTGRQSVQDTPEAEEYTRIDLCHDPSGTSTLFVYADHGKFYVEQPYQEVYEISREAYRWIIHGP